MPTVKIPQKGANPSSHSQLDPNVKEIRVRLLPPQNGAKEETASEESTEESKPSPFGAAFNYFCSNMDHLRKYLNVIDELARRTGFANLAAYSELLEEITKKQNQPQEVLARVQVALKIEAEGEITDIIKEFDISERSTLSRTMEFLSSQNAAHKILFRTSIQYMAGALEQLLSDLLRAHYKINTSALSTDKTISLAEIRELSNLDEVIDHFISNEVARLAMTSSEEQIALFDRTLKGKLREAFPEIDELVEVLIRRHAITHADGYASREYCQRLRKLTLSKAKIRPGERLNVDRNYINRAWDLTFAFGCILCELIWKQQAPKEFHSAESALTQAGYGALQIEQYKAAERVFKFAIDNERKDETQALMGEINYCIALKAQSRMSEIADRIKLEKWRTRSSLFQLAAAALREDTPELKRLLKICVDQKDLDLSSVLEFPLFKWLRESEHETGILRSAFGANPITVQTHLFHLLMLDPQIKKTPNTKSKARARVRAIPKADVESKQ